MIIVNMLFTPTDDAFAKLPAGTLDTLLLHSAQAVSGDTIAIATHGGGVTVDIAHVVTTDIAATSRVIHVIDGVVLPAER